MPARAGYNMNKSRISVFLLLLGLGLGGELRGQNMEHRGSEALEFESLRVETGLLSEDDEPSTYSFSWKNRGSVPISIVMVKSSCSCAVPSYSKTAVAVGESAEINVTYYPKGRPGGFTRRLYVYSSLSSKEPSAVLELVGEVSPSLRPVFDYPVAFGALLLKRSEVRMSQGQKQVERIECMNAGEKELNIEAESALLPEGVSVDKLRLAPGEIGDLVIRYKPGLAKMPSKLPVILKGLETAPRERTVNIVFQ